MQIIGLDFVKGQGLFPTLTGKPFQFAVDTSPPSAKIVDLAVDLLLPSATEGAGRAGNPRKVWGGRFVAAFRARPFEVELDIVSPWIKGFWWPRLATQRAGQLYTPSYGRRFH